MKTFTTYFILFSFVLIFSSCDTDLTPKPRGYYRIDLPQKNYTLFDSVYPYIFEYPTYARISPRIDSRSEPYWINIIFPNLNGEINVSFKKINTKDDLKRFINDSFEFTSKHVQKASSINEIIIRNDSLKVYGMLYDIQGIETASSCQFYMTDSTKNFFRGALYFNTRPNNDSLAPVIEFLKADINHLISTFKWKK